MKGGGKPSRQASRVPKPLMAEPLRVTGEGSKVLEITLPSGGYRLSWVAEAEEDHGFNFEVCLEDQSSEELVIEYMDKFSSGEVFARLPGGRHIFSVRASHLTWSIAFTKL